jgi:hypothetical protein
MHFVTFLNNSRRAVCSSWKRITQEAQNTGMFETIKCLSEDDLDSDWKSKHLDFCLNNKRGFGFYIWKSQVVYQSLCSLPENEIMLYTDAGCWIIDKNKDRFNYYKEKLVDKDILIFSPGNLYGFRDRSFTKKDLLTHMNHTEDTFQPEGGILLIKNNENSRNFMRQWVEICTSNNYHFVNDDPSIEPNYPEFIDHRHDQSIISILVHQNPDKVCVMATELYDPCMYPIYAARDRVRD